MRNLRLSAALATLAVCLDVHAARVSFERIIAAPLDLNAQDLAVIYAMGDNDRIFTFVDSFIREANQPGTLRVHDATGIDRESALRGFRRRYGAQVYLRVTAFSCNTEQRGGEGSSHDFEGKRVRVRHVWIDAICSAHIEVVEPESKSVVKSFDTRGEGTSPRVLSLTDEETKVAIDQAARYAAIAAAERITPRRVREVLILDEQAPAFADAAPLIEGERFGDARKVWDGLAARHAKSAPFHYNLGVICEAQGDIPSASEHYREAARLDPKFASDVMRFRKRYGLK
jgi:hypothetical protein